MKKLWIGVFAALFVIAHGMLCMCEEYPVLNITEFKDEALLKQHENDISRVTLRGKVTHASFECSARYFAIFPTDRR